jgi:hypothetical protein
MRRDGSEKWRDIEEEAWRAAGARHEWDALPPEPIIRRKGTRFPERRSHQPKELDTRTDADTPPRRRINLPVQATTGWVRIDEALGIPKPEPRQQRGKTRRAGRAERRQTPGASKWLRRRRGRENPLDRWKRGRVSVKPNGVEMVELRQGRARIEFPERAVQVIDAWQGKERADATLRQAVRNASRAVASSPQRSDLVTVRREAFSSPQRSDLVTVRREACRRADRHLLNVSERSEVASAVEIANALEAALLEALSLDPPVRTVRSRGNM